jgi:endonuclease III related protein
VKVQKIYDILLKTYGPQGWWPVTDTGKTIPKYKPRRFLTEKQKLEIIVGTILTQNTTWKNAEKAIADLQKKDLINIEKLRRINTKLLGKIIKTSGYYNQKAERIKLIAEFLKNNPISSLQKMKLPALREKLLNQKGVGKETADSIILYAFNKPIFVVDAYTYRLLSSLGNNTQNLTYDEIQEMFYKNLKKNPKLYAEFHALIVQHSKKLKENKSANSIFH